MALREISGNLGNAQRLAITGRTGHRAHKSWDDPGALSTVLAC